MKLIVRSGPIVMRLTREAPGRRPGFMGLLSFEGTRIEIGCRRSRKACQDAGWCENLSEIALTAKQTRSIPRKRESQGQATGPPLPRGERKRASWDVAEQTLRVLRIIEVGPLRCSESDIRFEPRPLLTAAPHS